ncbi:unnamed protein product [Notodromas monacha]|uniref:Uncharacterized protein n=1 Tax=Notodromas monacha TaxID=399045 RepID=A0A7R9GI10_9CRUS|nr:unnamed protein product [Notodromas monacha]CAG0923470.1 unnamed protein product [Notodromas monacha]
MSEFSREGKVRKLLNRLKFKSWEDIFEGKDLSSKVAVITCDGKSGASIKTCQILAKHGCRVVLASPNPIPISTGTNAENIRVVECNFRALRSVRNFANDFLALETRLDFLVLTADAQLCGDEVTEDGFEGILQRNYLAQFFLMCLLLDLLVRSSPSRIVAVCSNYDAHRLSTLNTSTFSRSIFFTRNPANSKSLYSTYADSVLCLVTSVLSFNRKMRNACRARDKTGSVVQISTPPVQAFVIGQNGKWSLRISAFLAKNPCFRMVSNAVGKVFKRSEAKKARLVCTALVAADSPAGHFMKGTGKFGPSETAGSKLFQEMLWVSSVDVIQTRMGPGSCKQAIWRGLNLAVGPMLSGVLKKYSVQED